MNQSNLENHINSNLNPSESMNPRPQSTSNPLGAQEDYFHYTMNRPI